MKNFTRKINKKADWLQENLPLIIISVVFLGLLIITISLIAKRYT